MLMNYFNVIILTQISGFVARRALSKLSCDVCHASLVTDAASAIKNQSYHLLSLKNNGGLVIPSEGTVTVVQAASTFKKSQPIKLLEVMYIVRKRIGSEDVFVLGEQISETQYGIDSHHHTLLTLVVSLFSKLRLHHIAKMTTISLQTNNMRQKLTKTILFKGHYPNVRTLVVSLWARPFLLRVSLSLSLSLCRAGVLRCE